MKKKIIKIQQRKYETVKGMYYIIKLGMKAEWRWKGMEAVKIPKRQIQTMQTLYRTKGNALQ